MVAAVGIALQSPEVQEWIEDQRRKLVELLRTVSEGIDPHTRREAEAFAFEGRMPTAQESSVSNDAIAVATGREVDGESASRRLNRQNSEAIDVAERRRLGREYLARRNQELLDMKKKRQSGSSEDTPNSLDEKMPRPDNADQNADETREMTERNEYAPGNFDALIDTHGSLLLDEKRSSAVSDTSTELPATNNIVAPIAASGFHAGAQYGNPFADEYSMSDPMLDRSETPKPPLPPKLPKTPELRAQQGFATTQPAEDVPQDLSFDEQLARALSISLEESDKQARNTRHYSQSEDDDFAQAIAESLKDAQRSDKASEAPSSSGTGLLVDFSSEVSRTHPMQETSYQSNNPWRNRSEDDDLYWLTPVPTGHQQQRSQAEEPPASSEAQDLTRALLGQMQETEQVEPRTTITSDDASKSQTLSPARQPSGLTSPTLSPSLPHADAISSGFNTDSEIEDFASLPDTSARSVGSMVEVEDVDIESMSDDDDGIATPSSWSDVGSDVGESERSESEAGDMVRL